MATPLYPASIKANNGTVSAEQPLSALTTIDLKGQEDRWMAYKDFWPDSTRHISTFVFNIPAWDLSRTTATLKVNFQGWAASRQKWFFELYNPVTMGWVVIGDNTKAVSWVWTVLEWKIPEYLGRYVVDGTVKLRYRSPAALENSRLDYVCLTIDAVAPVPVPEPVPTPLYPRVYGVTIDSIDTLAATLASVGALAKRPTVRVVFDEYQPATLYNSAVRQIAAKADVMGELLDSYYVKRYTLQEYLNRAKEYVALMKDVVAIWEVGNESNGEWLGTPDTVIPKIQGAFDIVRAAGKPTAITLFHNAGCVDDQTYEMFHWASTYLPASIKQNVDYALISYYDDDCPRPRPNWNEEFARLGSIFPNAKLGFGECGTRFAAKKAEYLKYFYEMKVAHPRYVHGHFWWYYKQDMVPHTTALWQQLNNTIKAT